jgi:hypothetical protein
VREGLSFWRDDVLRLITRNEAGNLENKKEWTNIEDAVSLSTPKI